MVAPDAPKASEGREITTAESGITVSKRVDTDRFPVPAIVFEIRSDRATPAMLRLLEVIPGDVPVEDLGFHDDFGIEFWAIEGNAAVFEREFDPGEEYRTVYGVRSTVGETIERLLTEPEIGVESSESDPSDAESPEAAYPDAGGPETDEPPADVPLADTPPADDSPVSAATADDTAAVLAAWIRCGTVADADVATLRDTLDERTERLETDTNETDTIETGATDIDATEPADNEPARRADEPADRDGSSDAAVERSRSRLVAEQEYRIMSEHPPADLTDAEIEAELRDIAALSDRERREYERRDHDVEQRGRELFGELD
jgi:hypothetical protein